jgi:hypothetical protein
MIPIPGEDDFVDHSFRPRNETARIDGPDAQTQTRNGQVDSMNIFLAQVLAKPLPLEVKIAFSVASLLAGLGVMFAVTPAHQDGGRW